MKRFFFAVLFVVTMTLSALVVGFCAGGLLHAAFGRSEGLADLGAMFNGAIVGALLGLVTSLLLLWRASPQTRLRVGISALGIAAFGALGTWIAVSMFGAW